MLKTANDPLIDEVKLNLNRPSVQAHFAFMRKVALAGVLISAAVLIMTIISMTNGKAD